MVELGSNTFENVLIPVLWGKRAILVDDMNQISVIDLSAPEPRWEIHADEVASGIEFLPTSDGFSIIDQNGGEVYRFSPSMKRLTGESLSLPELEFSTNQTRIGNGILRRNSVSNFAVGIHVQESALTMGTRLPDGLAPFSVN